jgi:hypothetical protein
MGHDAGLRNAGLDCRSRLCGTAWRPKDISADSCGVLPPIIGGLRTL